MYWYGLDRPLQVETTPLALAENARRVRAYSPAETAPVYENLEDWMRLLGYPGQDVFAVTLSVHEAVTNAFRHGNRGDASKHVQITYLLTSDEVLVEVQDQGDGFDFGRAPEAFGHEDGSRPVGRGLYLMRAYATWVCFHPPGNRVTLCRCRSNV